MIDISRYRAQIDGLAAGAVIVPIAQLHLLLDLAEAGQAARKRARRGRTVSTPGNAASAA